MHFKTSFERTKTKAKVGRFNKRVADMGRKRKVPVVNEEKENANVQQSSTETANKEVMMNNGPIYTIMSKVQLNESFHKKYIKELKQIYEKMNHDAFIFTFIKIIKSAMVADETNEFAYTTLLFCAKFVSSFEGEETHPLLADICRWLLTTISNNPHIRFRLCQFVNMILNALGNEATLDDVICDSIMEYMVGRLVDISPSVRVQAILAMQRLQVPDNPDDPVLRSYQYHLCSDPAPRVRQAVITSMGRNYHTIPYILDRLWDIDEKVRRHTYIHMSSYPVRSYKVSQRLTLLELGLNDRSESVRKVVTNVMLQQWIESYQKDLLSFLGALKLDSSETEINRFRKIGKQVLLEIFKRQNKADLVACLVLEEDGEYYRCVPYESLSLEMAFYWQCLTEYLQTEMAEELDQVIPELSVFCAYVETFYQKRKLNMDKFEIMEFQFILLSLMEILYTYDLGDEIGRGKLQELLHFLLKNCILDEKVIQVIVKCSENLITDQNARHQFFLDIIHDICGLNSKQQDLVHDRNLISDLLAHSTDADLNLKLSSLKVKILDLEEQEMNFVQIKDYVRAQQIIEEKNLVTEEFTNLLRPLLEIRNKDMGDSARPQFTKVVKNESILQSLQITYHMVVSKRIKSLQHSTCRLYNDFIYRNMASNQIAMRDWALKCGTAFSMLYEPLAKDVFDELYAQFFKNHNIRIWETAITCIFELLDRYGVDSFAVPEEQSKAKKTGRQLYNTLEFIDDTDDETRQSTTLGQGVGVIYMMSHFLDTCDDMCIVRAIVNGFCRLILHGYIDNRDIMEKLLLRYFNPVTDPEINQILGVFLENLVQQRKQNLLQPCLMITVNSVISAPYDSPLHDIRPETITRFIIDATRPDAVVSGNGSGENAHNKLALVFLNEMINNSNNKDLCKLLAKELLTLEVKIIQQEELKSEMKQLCDKLITNKFDPKTTKNIIDFKDMLDGVFNPPAKRTTDNYDSDDEDNEMETNPAIATIENVLSEETAPASADEDNTITNEQTITPSNATATNDLLESVQSAVISPSAANMPTTFGSENVTSHRLLRKSLNLSRNSSVDSNSATTNNDQAVVSKPTKIRIEARIDSDKKSKKDSSNQSPQRSNSKTRRNLRYNNRNNKNQNENGDDEFFRAKPREPEIIEKILNSPNKPATSPSSQNNEKVRQPSENQQNKSLTNSSPQLQQEKSNTDKEAASASDAEELDKSEVITESPTVSSPTVTLAVAAHSLRSMRTRGLRKVVKPSGKKAETSSSLAVIPAITPMRNGRKRVLQTSPRLVASPAMTSPTRKQSCVETSSTPTITTPRSSLSKTTPAKSPQPATKSKTPTASVSKQNSPVELNSSRTSTSEEVRNTATANKEKQVLKSVAASTNTPSAATNAKKGTRKNISIDQDQNHTVTTRNSARIERVTKNIMTRKRLSQENLASESIVYVKSPAGKLTIGKSRIPVRAQSVAEISSENTLERKTTMKNQRLGTSRIPSVRLLGLRKKPVPSSTNSCSTSSASSSSSANASSQSSATVLSGRFTRRRNV